MSSDSSFVFGSSAESTVFIELSHSASATTSRGGGGNRGGGDGGSGGFFQPPPPFTPTPSQSPLGTSTSASSTASKTTGSAILASTNSPQSASSTNKAPLGIIIGASVGGMVLGALVVALFFLCWRRRAQRKTDRPLAYNNNYGPGPDEERKVPSLDLDMPLAPPPSARRNTKVTDWRNNVVSVSTISSFSSPTFLDSVSAGNRTSVSQYSQMSGLASGESGSLLKAAEAGGRPRPPGLHVINE